MWEGRRTARVGKAICCVKGQQQSIVYTGDTTTALTHNTAVLEKGEVHVMTQCVVCHSKTLNFHVRRRQSLATRGSCDMSQTSAV